LREQGDLHRARQLFEGTGQTTPDALAWAWDRAHAAVAPTTLTLDEADIGYVRGFYGT
jgi:hypothetical protein